MGLAWDKFIASLSSGIDWYGDLSAQRAQIEDLLLALYRNREEVIARFAKTIRDKDIFKEYFIHMEYPRPVMDKFVLHMDSQDRFRVRLHKFKTTVENRKAEATIHDHRWHFFSILLCGSYRECIYEIVDEDESARQATLNIVNERILTAGDINSSAPRIPHMTINESATDPCFSLFMRGPSLFPDSRIFNRETGTFRLSGGLQTELEREIELLTRGCTQNSSQIRTNANRSAEVS